VVDRVAQALEVIEVETASVDTAAEKLQVAPATVGSMLSRGQLKGIRVGRAVRIPHDELQAFLKQRNN